MISEAVRQCAPLAVMVDLMPKEAHMAVQVTARLGIVQDHTLNLHSYAKVSALSTGD